MAKFYNIGSERKSDISECSPFEVDKQEETNEYSSTYMEVLNILKEALSYVDITKIIKKL